MVKKKSREEKAIDKRVEASYYRTCSGIQISVMDIGKVFDAGKKAIAAGADDAALDVAVRAFVETIRSN